MDHEGGTPERVWHRRLATSLFNSTWDLIEQAERSEEDNAEMLLSAITSCWHWGQVGRPEQVATGDWQVSHVAALLGMGDLAQLFASRCLAVTEAQGWDGWRLASAHEAMARACATRGDPEGRARHIAAAQSALEGEADQDDRQVVAGQLATIP